MDAHALPGPTRTHNTLCKRSTAHKEALSAQYSFLRSNVFLYPLLEAGGK